MEKCTRDLLAIAALLTLGLPAFAQSSTDTPGTGARTPVDGGAIIMPPKGEPGMVKTPPRNVDPGAISHPPKRVDPGMIERPPATAAPDTHRPARSSSAPPDTMRKSKRDDCRGPAELCKQDSAR